MQASLVGAFRCEDVTSPEDSLDSWKCAICSTANGVVSDGSPPRCKTCHRLQNPQWLRLEDFGLQIVLGSRVFHTSAGGLKSASIVIAINYFQKLVTLLRIKTKRSEGGPAIGVSFHKVVLSAPQLQQQLEPLDAELVEDSVVDDYGICGDCREVFRIVQGDKQSLYANEDNANVLKKEIQQLDKQKHRLAREKAYERVLECTKQIKLREKELQVAKRQLEILGPIFCPFCGWSVLPTAR